MHKQIRDWRIMAILASLALTLMVISSGGCGPVAPPGPLDGNRSESGGQSDGARTEDNSSDAGGTDSSVQDNAGDPDNSGDPDNGGTDTTVQDNGGDPDNGGTDTTVQDSGTTDNGGTDTTVVDNGTDPDNGGTDTVVVDNGTQDAGTQDHVGTDTVVVDNGTQDNTTQDNTTQDNVGTDVSVGDGSGRLCLSKGGYCGNTSTACKAGFVDANDPMDCPGGRTARCCVMKKPPVQCTSACDCTQGLACVNGKCLAAKQPVYCCSNPGCPSGQKCVNKNGTAGTCPVATNDCTKQGGYCTPQNTSCRTGFKLDTATRCGNVRSLLCCKPVNKCLTVKCSGPTCLVGRDGSCTQTTYTCNPATGNCDASKKSAKVSCRQSGTSCIQVKPACSNNACVSKSGTIANATCDTATGQCKPTAPKCTTNCDCTQGLLCDKNTGKCLAGIVPAYCCSKAGCPAGKKCTNKDGSAGTCPATTNDCTKKNGVCIAQFTSCPRGYKLDTSTTCGSIRGQQCCLPVTNPCATIRCLPPSCAGSLNSCTQRTYTCNPSTGKCDKKETTTTPACKMSGTSCVQSTPVCSNNQCSATTKTAKVSCRQNGTSCIQVNPTCTRAGTCSSSSTTKLNSTCDTSTGLCGKVSTTKTCTAAGGKCQNSRLICPRGTTANRNYTCSSLAEICCL